MPNPIVEAINEARRMSGHEPGPPGGVILPTRAVDYSGRPLSDHTPFQGADGSVERPDMQGFLDHGLMSGTTEILDARGEVDRNINEDQDELSPRYNDMTTRRWADIDSPTAAPRECVDYLSPPLHPSEQNVQNVGLQVGETVVLPQRAAALWASRELHLTADEVSDIEEVLQRAAIRQLDDERATISNMRPRKKSRAARKRKKKVQKVS
jgi:hypothetical protein